MRCWEENTVNKIEEKPEKLKNKLLITDYAKVKRIKSKTVATTRKPWQLHFNFQPFKWTRIQVFHDNNRNFKSRMLLVEGERCPVALFESFVRFYGAKTSTKTSMRWSVFFHLSSKRNRKFNLKVSNLLARKNELELSWKVRIKVWTPLETMSLLFAE